MHIFEEGERIKRAGNSLKFARGEPFKEEHWTAMFKKLGMSKHVKLDNVTVGHFLEVLDALAASGPWLKDLHGRYVTLIPRTKKFAVQYAALWCRHVTCAMCAHPIDVLLPTSLPYALRRCV